MRRTDLRPRPPADHRSEPGYREWTKPTYGHCAVCGEEGPLERHHVIKRQHLRAEGLPVWDLRNSMLLGRYCRCHSRHTNAAVLIPLAAVPVEAQLYAVELLGEARAADYLARFYAG